MYDPFRGRLKIHDEEKCLGISPFTSKNKEECPMKGRMCQCSAKENCIHIDKNKEEERCQECLIYFNRRGGVPDNVTLRPQIECVLHRDILSPQSPLSEEYLIKDLLGCMRGTTEEYRLTILKDFIRTTHLEAQRELAEELLKDIQFDLDKGRFYSICSNETALKDYIRGLLPKITE